MNSLKSYKNLRTPISNLMFNSTSEILAMSSDSMQAATRLAHVPTHTVFSNFPAFKDKSMQYPRQVQFSPNSGFLAIGNSSGRVYLYRLNHYERYWLILFLFLYNLSSFIECCTVFFMLFWGLVYICLKNVASKTGYDVLSGFIKNPISAYY